jgi:preprotein translocase subunit SecE
MGRILRKKPTILKKKKRQDSESSGAAFAVAASGGPTASAPKTEAAAEAVRKPEAKRPTAPAPALPASAPADNVLTRAAQFLREVKIELKKVTWPTRKQTMGSTLVVIVLVVIISLFLGLVDLGLSAVVRAVFRA